MQQTGVSCVCGFLSFQFLLSSGPGVNFQPMYVYMYRLYGGVVLHGNAPNVLNSTYFLRLPFLQHLFPRNLLCKKKEQRLQIRLNGNARICVTLGVLSRTTPECGARTRIDHQLPSFFTPSLPPMTQFSALFKLWRKLLISSFYFSLLQYWFLPTNTNVCLFVLYEFVP